MNGRMDGPDHIVNDAAESSKSEIMEPVVVKKSGRPGSSWRIIAVLAIFVLLAAITWSNAALRYKIMALALHKVSIQILVEDRISGQPLQGAAVSFNGKSLHTGEDGTVQITANKGTKNVQIAVSKSGFIASNQSVYFVNDTFQSKAAIDLLHTGTIYFLRQQNDFGETRAQIVQSNLDGSDQQVIYQGNGQELQTASDNTGNSLYGGPSLLAAQDWKHLAYITRNDGIIASCKSRCPAPKTMVRLYIIDTGKTDKQAGEDQATQADTALQVGNNQNNSLQLIGWMDDRHLAYELISVTGQQQIKSYDLATGKVTTLLAGKNNMGFSAVYIIGGKLIFAEDCTLGGNNNAALDEAKAIAQCKQGGLQSRIVSITASGQVATLKLLDEKWKVGIVTNNIYGPDALYFTIYGAKNGVYYYEYNGQAVVGSTKSKAENNQQYHSALSSQDGSNVFWLQGENAKNASDLYVASGNGTNAEKVRTLPAHFYPYGWSGKYMILSRDDGQLYVTEPFSTKDPLQISGHLQSQKAFDNAMGGYPGAGFGYGDLY